jgi:peroxiredoxin
MKSRGALIILSTVALLALLAYLRTESTGLKTVPDIALITLNGEELQLANLRGRPVLVTFWATTCHSCVREIPHLIALYNELAPQGLEIIGIAMSYDPPNRVLALRNARNIPYPIALDIHGDAARAFGDVRLTPTSFLIATDGRIVFQRTGEMNMAALRRDIIAMLDATRTRPATPSPVPWSG